MNYKNQLKKWYASTEINLCNTEERLSLNCMQSYWGFNDYVYYVYLYNQISMWSQIQDNDICSQKMFTSTYWGLLNT